jgi:hypothetical protein
MISSGASSAASRPERACSCPEFARRQARRRHLQPNHGRVDRSHRSRGPPVLAQTRTRTPSALDHLQPSSPTRRVRGRDSLAESLWRHPIPACCDPPAVSCCRSSTPGQAGEGSGQGAAGSAADPVGELRHVDDVERARRDGATRHAGRPEQRRPPGRSRQSAATWCEFGPPPQRPQRNARCGCACARQAACSGDVTAR